MVIQSDKNRNLWLTSRNCYNWSTDRFFSNTFCQQIIFFLKMTRLFCTFELGIWCILYNFLFVYFLPCWPYLMLVWIILHSNICSCLEADPELTPQRISWPADLRLNLRRMSSNCFWHRTSVYQFPWVCSPALHPVDFQSTWFCITSIKWKSIKTPHSFFFFFFRFHILNRH